MDDVRWGIIGCGDVTEKKSGPAFNKVAHSRLVAVMRRNAAKAEDYAKRHSVPKWYSDAEDLLQDPGINAIYIATPPASHEDYTLRALEAGKSVYLEKPMSINASSAMKMMQVAERLNKKVVVAHYRRAQPFFTNIKRMIDAQHIGAVRFTRSLICKRSLSGEELTIEKTAWRVDPAVAGGGLFHDLAPHQLDLLYYFFGEIENARGIASNQGGLYTADDMVSGNILFKNGVHFSGDWCFNVSPSDERDECEIIGEKGRMVFSFFDQKPLKVFIGDELTEYPFQILEHVQQPMIEKVVEHFLDKGPNPCTAWDGVQVMKLIDHFTGKT
jgi:predicted dehydrogenase